MKARGLCPLDPRQGLSPWNPVRVGTGRPAAQPLVGGPGGESPPGVQPQSPPPYCEAQMMRCSQAISVTG